MATMTETVRCKRCGKLFYRTKGAQKYCSSDCQTQAQKVQRAEWKKRQKDESREDELKKAKATIAQAKKDIAKAQLVIQKAEATIAEIKERQARKKAEKKAAEKPVKVAEKKKKRKPKNHGFELQPDKIPTPKEIELTFAERYRRAKDPMSKETLIAKQAGYTYGKWQELRYINEARWHKVRDYILASENLKDYRSK